MVGVRWILGVFPKSSQFCYDVRTWERFEMFEACLYVILVKECLRYHGILGTLYFWCFSLSQIEDSVYYLERPYAHTIGIGKHHDRHIGVHLDPNMPIIVLPDTIWPFQVLNRVPYL